MRGGHSVILVLFASAFAACPADALPRPIGDICDSHDACVGGLCVENRCIEPGLCTAGLIEANLPPELGRACIAGILSLTVVADPSTLVVGASVQVRALARYAAPADQTASYDVTRAATFEHAPTDHVSLDRTTSPGYALSVDDTFLGGRVTIRATLVAGDAVRDASLDVNVVHPPGWGVPEALAPTDSAAIPVALGLDTDGCAHLLWVAGGGARLGTTRRCASGWGAPTILAAPVGGATVTRATLSVAPSGDAVATWIVAPAGGAEPSAFEVWAARHTPTEGWAGLPERLAAPPAGVLVTNLGAACAGPEAAIVAWQEMTADAFPVRARRLLQGGWGDAEDVDALGSVLGIPSQGMGVTLTTHGTDAQVLWHDAAATYASISRGDAWEARVIVIDNLALGTPIAFGDVAWTVDGHVLITGYGGFDNGVGVPEARIDARIFVPGKGWGDAMVVEKTSAAGVPRAAFTSAGAALVWPIAMVAAPRVQIALGRWSAADAWSRAIVLDEFPRVGQAAVTPVAIATSLLATWVVYRRVGSDQVERLTATRGDAQASGGPTPILAPASGALGAFVFATGPSGNGLAVAAVTDATTTTLWAVPLYP